jgi:predicted Zn-dependent protease
MPHPRSHETHPAPSEVRLAGDLQAVNQYPELLAAAGQGIVDVNQVAGLEREINASLFSQADALSFITSEFKNQYGQVKIEPFLDNLINNGFANPNDPSYILISDDLVAEGTNFVFGITLKQSGISIQSLHRYSEAINDQHTLKEVTQLIARHEYGHLLGLDASTIRNKDRRAGKLYQGHCANECTMQQVMSVQQAVNLNARLKNKPQAGFCADCAKYLASLSL